MYYDAEKITVKMSYDIIDNITSGKVYSKESHEELGIVVEEPKGTCKLELKEENKNKEYIKEEFEKLKPELVSYANMWAARAGRGKC